MNSIEGELENNLDKLVEWIHPETNLFSLVEKHLPEQDVFEKLSEVKKSLDEQMKDTPYKIIADSDGKLSLVGKYEKAHEEMPFIINSTFKFDTKTNEGKEALLKLEDHFKKGSPVEIEGKHIESINFPEFLPDFLKPPKVNEKTKLILIPNRSESFIPFKVERKLHSGEVIGLDRVDMQIVQPGLEETTLKNDKQDVPWQFTFVINSKKRSLNFNFTYKFFGYNVRQHLLGLKYYEASLKDGTTRIFNADTNIKFIDSKTKIIGKGHKNGEFSYTIKILESLVLIQETFNIDISIPDRHISEEEIQNIFEVVLIIKTGKAWVSFSDVTLFIPIDEAVKTKEQFKEQKESSLFGNQEHIVDILGNEINIGKSIFKYNGFIKKSNFVKIEKQIKNRNEKIEFCFTPSEKSVLIDFLDFECEDRHLRYQFSDS